MNRWRSAGCFAGSVFEVDDRPGVDVLTEFPERSARSGRRLGIPS